MLSSGSGGPECHDAMTTRIRPVEPSRDGVGLAFVYRPFVLKEAVTFEMDPPNGHEMTRRASMVHKAGFPFFVATTNTEANGQGTPDQLIGFAYASPFRSREAYGSTVETTIYIDRAYLGQGIGRKLMQAVLNRLEAMGKRQVLAVIADVPGGESVAFHQKLGFETVGRLERVGYKLSQEWDVLLMQMTLGER